MRLIIISSLIIVGLLSSHASCLASSPEVLNPETWEGLNDRQRNALETSGFVVTPQGEPQMYNLYQSVANRGWPVFVTTDAALHVSHVLYDFILRHAEYGYLVPALVALTKSVLETSLVQMQSASPVVRAAARDNAAFFAVAQQLLDPSAGIPAEVDNTVRAELNLISAHWGVAQSPMFGVDEDYSQYVPRGHYTRNETFARYFRTMMWLGRMPFLLKPGDAPEKVEVGRHLTRQAILMVYGLQNSAVAAPDASVGGTESAWSLWERIYQVTAFFVGKTDDLSPYDYRRLIEEVYGPGFGPADLEDTVRLDQFIEQAMALPPPRIISSPVTDQEDAALATKGFRFMGQRFVFDSYIFQQLVYDRVGVFQGDGQPFTATPAPFGLIRGFPRGLDIAAAFGSDHALEIMQREGDTQYEGYDAQMRDLRQEVSTLPPDQWSENLYWSWLHSLRPLLAAKEHGYPDFMRSQAWLDKDLHTFLGSWTELRHDTVLYAKQSMTIGATAAQPQPERRTPPGYVEPQPEVYGRLAALCEQTVVGLDAYRVLDSEVKSKLGRWSGVLRALEMISLRELEGDLPSEEDANLIQRFGDLMENLSTFLDDTGGAELTTETDEWMALVTDVHTDVNSGQVLQEAIGDAFPIYAIVSGKQGVWTVVGGVFSYYEFKQLMDNRMTDDAWQSLTPKPPRPDWTSAFVVE